MDTSDKDAYTDAVRANELRNTISNLARKAVNGHHVAKDWANTWLGKLGAEPVTGQAEYRLNTPITGVFGKTVYAESRAEALTEFAQEVARVKGAGQISDGRCDSVYSVTFPEVTPTFFSGPEDLVIDHEGPELDLQGVEDGIRAMLKEGVAEHGWSYRHAQHALGSMNLEMLPGRSYRTVEVPVTGTALVSVSVFDDDTDTDVDRAVRQLAKKNGMLSVKPDEIGSPGSQAADPATF